MKYFPFFLLILAGLPVGAQDYWQQTVATTIDVRLDDRKHELHAKETLTYTNNSPDTLKSIYMHVWPNAYQNDHTPFAQQFENNGNTSFYFSKPNQKGYIDSLDFTVDGRSVDFYIPESTPDIARIDLRTPLLPHQSIKIATPFMVKIPAVFSRLGHTKQAYFISQWFPKPAVYDRKGWHPISYLNLGEFYSEYGSYDVSITLPKNYVVMATGNCTDEAENKWLDSLAALPLPSDTVYKYSAPASDLETKTVHFHEDNVHDFAWFADKRWVVRKDTVTSPGSGNVVTAYAAFMPSYQKAWKNACGYLRETVLHYGKWVGPYPYKTVKAVLGDMRAGGGMEYPTVTVIDRNANSSLKTVVIHEAGHNWFYGMLGSNERDHAWMDEGINTFYEQKTSLELAADTTKKSKGSGVQISMSESNIYFELAATHKDQPIEQTSAAYPSLNYGVDIYYKTALFLRYLEQYMGKDDFEKGMKLYYDKWHLKHPYPEDFRACMQQATPMNLDWFFDGMMHTDQKIDLSVTVAATHDQSTTVFVTNKSGIPVPALIDVYRDDTLVAQVWSRPFMHDTTIEVPVKDWSYLKVDSVVPDSKKYNNYYKNTGLSHRYGLKLRPFVGTNETRNEKVFWLPAVGYNQYDGFSVGLLFHNLTYPENRFRFMVTPLYAFGSNSVNGAASLGYVWYPKQFKEIMLQGDAKSFHYAEALNLPSTAVYARYTKTALILNFTFNEHNNVGEKNNFLSPVTRSLMFKAYNIQEEMFTGDSSLVNAKLGSQTKAYGLVRYTHLNQRTFNPFSYTLEGQAGEGFAKLGVEGKARVDYNKRKKYLFARVYLGKYFAFDNSEAVVSRYELNASYSGINDYLYDGTYIGRTATDHIAAQQVSMQEGGFKVPVYNGAARSDNWMATINLATDLPIKLPIRLFLDAGLMPNVNPSEAHNNASTLLYDGGVEVHLIKDIVSVYVPVIMSDDFSNYLKNSYGNKSFARGISFTMQLQNINWLQMPGKLLKLGGG